MNIESAQISLIGDRQSNQDRADIVVADTQFLLAVADGMGGHADGEKAAATAVGSLIRSFQREHKKLSDGANFLEQALIESHKSVVALGKGRALDNRPCTTCTVCLVDNGTACWAHVGDSRVYLLRDGKIVERTLDHSHVESLLQAGLISESDLVNHPLRHLVDQCLGGEEDVPTIDVSHYIELVEGDILLLCTDGFWSPLNPSEMARRLCQSRELEKTLEELAQTATRAAHPISDNTTALACRWLGP